MARTRTRRGWTPEAMIKVRQVGGAQVSPDGKRVAYVVRQAVMSGEKSEFAIPDRRRQRRWQRRIPADPGRSFLRRPAVVARRRAGRFPEQAVGKDPGLADPGPRGRGAAPDRRQGGRRRFPLVAGRLPDRLRRNRSAARTPGIRRSRRRTTPVSWTSRWNGTGST